MSECLAAVINDGRRFYCRQPVSSVRYVVFGQWCVAIQLCRAHGELWDVEHDEGSPEGDPPVVGTHTPLIGETNLTRRDVTGPTTTEDT